MVFLATTTLSSRPFLTLSSSSVSSLSPSLSLFFLLRTLVRDPFPRRVALFAYQVVLVSCHLPRLTTLDVIRPAAAYSPAAPIVLDHRCWIS